MPDAQGNPTLQDLVVQGVTPLQFAQPFAPAVQGFSPFIQSELGQSPATQAAADAFQQIQLPIIQNQAALAGLGNSPALLENVSLGLAQVLPQFISQGLQNRLQASQGLGQLQDQAGQLRLGAADALATQSGLNQQAAQLASNIANQAAQRQLQAAQLGGQLQLNQQQQALQGLAGAGQLQRGIQQEALDAQQAERLRLQGLGEQGTFGLFGGTPVGAKVTTEGGK